MIKKKRQGEKTIFLEEMYLLFRESSQKEWEKWKELKIEINTRDTLALRNLENTLQASFSQINPGQYEINIGTGKKTFKPGTQIRLCLPAGTIWAAWNLK